ncbi:hypothetical protein J4221_07150 [Candidatus Pacearchaeota archaeon]|nr:hypothetical protein [Candidatus Pacearchaeota archaeon]
MEKDIGRIKKNDVTEIVVRLDDFGGKVGLTIREFTTSDRYTGFTKSGTRIPAESFKEFKEMINSIDESDFGSFTEEKEEPKKEIKKDKKQKTLGETEDSSDETEEIEEEVF